MACLLHHLLRSIPLLITVLIPTLLIGLLRAAEPTYSLQVVTDRDEALYKVGDEAVFLITLSRGEDRISEGSVSFLVDDFLSGGKAAGLPEGMLPLNSEPARVVVKGRRPEFLRCQVTYDLDGHKPLRSVATAGFSPEAIAPSLPVPDDFDDFWAEQKRRLAAVPLDPMLTPVAQNDAALECYDAQVACLGGAPVSGYFSKPKQAKPQSLAAVLWVHGAGVRSSNLDNAVKGAQAGLLSMDINAHGIPNGQPDEFYANERSERLKGYPFFGRESRDTTYFRGMYLRLIRAIDFLTSQPEWNGQQLAVIGHSQGGGQALVAGGLDSRVTLVAAGVPAMCDHTGMAVGRISGWPKLVIRVGESHLNPQFLEAARYVDAVNFASRCRTEAILSVGFIDGTCPPSTGYAAYNALRGKKRIINEPLMGHVAAAHIEDAFFAQLLEHVHQPQ